VSAIIFSTKMLGTYDRINLDRNFMYICQYIKRCY